MAPPERFASSDLAKSNERAVLIESAVLIERTVPTIRPPATLGSTRLDDRSPRGVLC